ncbi:hypothetical protein LZ318_04350 [Saccharopolyspora indica]|uniref:hypothetical protein n=1 Tax=Saccharopolyspora indica TaxID=1229659 RepID=UPI0022EB0E97|nr:hypothetical protein [Saccharopolyspora indica]MDA3646447.1 hypothetical protein [Saccharopolyspora indica]
MLSDRAVALARRAGDQAARLRAEALALFASNRLGRGVPATGRALAAVRDAESAGDAEVTAELRVELAWCACAAGSPEVAARILRPVLEQERIEPSLRAHALLALAASMPVHQQDGSRTEALDEAERLYGAGEGNRDIARLLQARVCAARAGHHRRLGEFAEATEAADAGLDQLHQLGDPAADSGEIRTRLVLERVQSLLELGHRPEAVTAAEKVLAEPVRAAAAGPVGWLGLALATRVHLPNGDHAAALRVLGDTAAISERHKLDGLLAEALNTLSQVHERGSEFPDALRALRGAYAADRRWRAAVHHARVRLLAEYPELSKCVDVPRQSRGTGSAESGPSNAPRPGPRPGNPAEQFPEADEQASGAPPVLAQPLEARPAEPGPFESELRISFPETERLEVRSDEISSPEPAVAEVPGAEFGPIEVPSGDAKTGEVGNAEPSAVEARSAEPGASRVPSAETSVVAATGAGGASAEVRSSEDSADQEAADPVPSTPSGAVDQETELLPRPRPESDDAADAARLLMESLTNRAAELREERRHRQEEASGPRTPDEPTMLLDPALFEDLMASAHRRRAEQQPVTADAPDQHHEQAEGNGRSDWWPTELLDQPSSAEDTFPDLPATPPEPSLDWQIDAEPDNAVDPEPPNAAAALLPEPLGADLPAETTTILPVIAPEQRPAVPRHGAPEPAAAEAPEDDQRGEAEPAGSSADEESSRGGRRSRGRSLAEIRASLQLPEQPRGGRRRARHAEPDEPAPAAEAVARHRQPEQAAEATHPELPTAAPEPPLAELPAEDTHPNLPVAEPEPPVDSGVPEKAGLAELLTEALLAYESGRRDEAEAGTARAGRHSEPHVSGITEPSRVSRSSFQSTSDDRGAGAVARHRRPGFDAAATDPLF